MPDENEDADEEEQQSGRAQGAEKLPHLPVRTTGQEVRAAPSHDAQEEASRTKEKSERLGIG